MLSVLKRISKVYQISFSRVNERISFLPFSFTSSSALLRDHWTSQGNRYFLQIIEISLNDLLRTGKAAERGTKASSSSPPALSIVSRVAREILETNDAAKKRKRKDEATLLTRLSTRSVALWIPAAITVRWNKLPSIIDTQSSLQSEKVRKSKSKQPTPRQTDRSVFFTSRHSTWLTIRVVYIYVCTCCILSPPRDLWRYYSSKGWKREREVGPDRVGRWGGNARGTG